MSVPYGHYSVAYRVKYPHDSGYTARFESTVTFARERDSDDYPNDVYKHAENAVHAALRNRSIDPETADLTIDFDSLQRQKAP